MSDHQRNLPNFYFSGLGSSTIYSPPKRRREEKTLPQRNRQEHAERLLDNLEQSKQEYRLQKASRELELVVGEPGFYLEFQMPESGLKIVGSLENKTNKIELLNIGLPDENCTTVSAVVFVPDQALEFFPSKIEAYRDEDTIFHKPKNQRLIANLNSITTGTVRSLFIGKSALFPASESQEVWWEVWLRQGSKDLFSQVANALGIRTTEHIIRFPEREVVLALTNVEMLSLIIRNNGLIAELRLANDTPYFFFEQRYPFNSYMDMNEQVSWVEDLINRTIVPPDTNVFVCLLDNGITRSHRLIQPLLDASDVLTYDPSWGYQDNSNNPGHGTSMAGIALYGDLYNALTTSSIILTHRLESVKILPNQEENVPSLYGAITLNAVLQVINKNPSRQRVICMAVTSDKSNDIKRAYTNIGVPSSWSATVDQICFKYKQLMVIPVGNIEKYPLNHNDYPDLNDISESLNPSQAWNALVVGAYTDKVNIANTNYAGYHVIAPAGSLSPRSRTSLLWDPKWPTRPDVTFEGGNLASIDLNSEGEDLDELQLLTTFYQSNKRQFTLFGDTSAATALCSYMAARIWTEHSEYWAETVRALIVHSAEWTPAMLQNLPEKPSQSKKILLLLRRYGYGVPSLGKALFSSQSDLTMIFEDKLKPFRKVGSNAAKSNELNYHQLPLPSEELRALGSTLVELKVTLSYFVEPNPGERGILDQHSYASHGLRFNIKRSSETLSRFRLRINQLERKGSHRSDGEDEGWFLGNRTWSRSGSIFSDIWTGTAVSLAEKDAIAIYPVGGWWKYNSKEKGWNNIVRYTLIASIKLIERADINLYTPIAVKLGLTIPTFV